MQQEPLIGVWALEVDTSFFGKHPATLRVEPGAAGGELQGRVESQLGNVELAEMRATGAGEYEAGAAHEVRGKIYNARLTARVNGDALEGTIKVDLFFAPTVRFTGTRQQAS